MSGEIARKVIASFQRPAHAPLEEARLTPREADILGLLTRGYANKEIAEHLGVGYETVRTHLCNIYQKLHVRSRTEAAAKYLQAPEQKA